MNTVKSESLDAIIDEGCKRIAADLRSSWIEGGKDMKSLYEILSFYEYEEILNNYGPAIYRSAENRLFNAFLAEASAIRLNIVGMCAESD